MATIHVTKPFTDDWILPETAMGMPRNLMELEGCPGQVVRGTFTVHADNAVADFLPAPGNLVGQNGYISSLEIDVRAVACWWQATCSHTTRQWMKQSTTDRELTPELLVYDPSFLRREGQDNYLKQANGSYVKVSDQAIGAPLSAPAAATMDIRDSGALQKTIIPAGSNQQYWVSIRIPSDCAAGIYAGEISLGSVGSVVIRVGVLPFQLEPCPIPHVMFTFFAPGAATIGTRQHSSAQIAAELRSICTPGTSLSIEAQEEAAIRSILIQMRNMGVTGTELQYTGLSWLMDVASGEAGHLSQLRQYVQRVLTIANQQGFTEVYFHAIDEASADAIAPQKANFDAVHAAGGLIYVDGYTGVYEAAKACGAKIDLMYWPTFPSSAEIAKWHSAGAKIGMYGDPHSGVALTGTWRRHYGLRLWQAGLDGAQIFWQWNAGGMIWNDFCNPVYVQECMAYPTANGCIETTQLEADREAVTDLRFLATLQAAIRDAEGSTAEAEEYLQWLKGQNLAAVDLDEIRTAMTDHILALKGLSGPPAPEPPPTPTPTQAGMGWAGVVLGLGAAAAAVVASRRASR